MFLTFDLLFFILWIISSTNSPRCSNTSPVLVRAKPSVLFIFSFNKTQGQFADDSLPCPICHDEHRRNGQLLVVEKDADLEAIEKAGSFAGQYFVLGGLVPILTKEPEKKIRLAGLVRRIETLAKAKQLTEIIFALAVTTEADHTIEYLKERLAKLAEQYSLKFTLLGRGLSGGLEIEYSDPDTLKSALENRH